MENCFVLFDNLWNCVCSIHKTYSSAEKALEIIKNDEINQNYSIVEHTLYND